MALGSDVEMLSCAGEQSELLPELLHGDFTAALTCKASQPWLQPRDEGHASLSEYFRAVEQQASLQSTAADSLLQLQVAVAAFLTFVQANLTG